MTDESEQAAHRCVYPETVRETLSRADCDKCEYRSGCDNKAVQSGPIEAKADEQKTTGEHPVNARRPFDHYKPSMKEGEVYEKPDGTHVRIRRNASIWIKLEYVETGIVCERKPRDVQKHIASDWKFWGVVCPQCEGKDASCSMCGGTGYIKTGENVNAMIYPDEGQRWYSAVEDAQFVVVTKDRYDYRIQYDDSDSIITVPISVGMKLTDQGQWIMKHGHGNN